MYLVQISHHGMFVFAQLREKIFIQAAVLIVKYSMTVARPLHFIQWFRNFNATDRKSFYCPASEKTVSSKDLNQHSEVSKSVIISLRFLRKCHVVNANELVSTSRNHFTRRRLWVVQKSTFRGRTRALPGLQNPGVLLGAKMSSIRVTVLCYMSVNRHII